MLRGVKLKCLFEKCFQYESIPRLHHMGCDSRGILKQDNEAVILPFMSRLY